MDNKNTFNYIMADVLKQDGCDCTNHGVSSLNRHIFVCQEGTTLEQIENRCKDSTVLNPELFFVVETICVNSEYKRLKSPYIENQKKWSMAGGNFAYTSDSRWEEITGVKYPLSIHDRVEEW